MAFYVHEYSLRQHPDQNVERFHHPSKLPRAPCINPHTPKVTSMF